MNFSTEQAARVTSVVNEFGDYLAQDHNTDAMHRCLAVIRHELVEECDPLGHPELRDQLDWIDRTLDRVEARRMVAIQHIAANLQRGPAGRYLN
jgi:hypothetical protein